MIPRWVSRIVWAFRGKRRVRLHLVDAPKVPLPSLEGILVGCWGGHYVLLTPKALTSTDGGPTLEGYLEVPRERVAFVQVLSS